MIPCYVSGKGMHATPTTWAFKTLVIEVLESDGLGYDTRYRYYRRQFPELARPELARLICDPIEYYDRDWPGYRSAQQGRDDGKVLTEFWLARDRLFRDEARAAIYCYDEAGFGSGVNTLRFLYAGRPVLGFYNSRGLGKTVNLSNVMQLGLEYPDLFTLLSYERTEEIGAEVKTWLGRLASQTP
jgi:hypothetical protein